MRIVVVTSVRHGFASLCLPDLLREHEFEIVGVLLNEGRSGVAKRLTRILKKIRRIGLRGAINGLRMRSWYDLNHRCPLRDIESIANENRVPVKVVSSFQSTLAIEALASFAPDLAISLGNPIIPKAVFKVPRLGMLNIHHELLPEFRGAQTAIWQLHRGHRTTGFTIHCIDQGVDTGRIVMRQECEILMRPTLRQTVIDTYEYVCRRSCDALIRVLREPEVAIASARSQPSGVSYTTPSWRQFQEIQWQFLRLSESGR